jgi:hypothetical protein
MDAKSRLVTGAIFLALAVGTIFVTVYALLFGSAECPRGEGSNLICLPIAIAERIAPGEGTPTLVFFLMLLTTLFFHLAFNVGRKPPA